MVNRFSRARSTHRSGYKEERAGIKPPDGVIPIPKTARPKSGKMSLPFKNPGRGRLMNPVPSRNLFCQGFNPITTVTRPGFSEADQIQAKGNLFAIAELTPLLAVELEDRGGQNRSAAPTLFSPPSNSLIFSSSGLSKFVFLICHFY